MSDPTDRATIAGGAKRRRGRGPRVARRVVVVVMALVAFLTVGIVAAGAGILVSATRGMPSLTQLLQQNQVAQTTVIYDRSGNLIAELHGPVNRMVVSSSQIPVALKDATVAVEDQRFYDHHGIDFIGVARAALADLRAGAAVQGASTITEQYIKNAYLGSETGLERKIREAVLAWELEDRWSKDQILTAYLNTVYYGAGAYGVQSAAQTYFHRNVSQLTLAQCALLAALPRFPAGYSPITDAAAAKARRDLVLQLMAAQGYITQAQAVRAAATPSRCSTSPRPP